MILILLPSLMLLPLFTARASAQSGLIFHKTWGSSRSIDQDVAYGVAVDSSDNVYVTGETQNNWVKPTYAAVTLLKYNRTGSLLWQRMYTASNSDQSGASGYGVAVDGSGNVCVTGDTLVWDTNYSSPLYSGVLLLKFDSSGSLLWQKVYPNPFQAPYGSVAIDSSGNIYAAGRTEVLYPGDCSNIGCWNEALLLLKLNSTGVLLWQRIMGGSDTVGNYNQVAVDSSGNVYVAGSESHFNPSYPSDTYDVHLLKLDSSGSLLWQETIGSTDIDLASGVAADPSGNVYVTGWTWGFGAGGPDVLLLKFNSSGSLLWQKTWGGSDFDMALGLAVDSSGNSYVTGRTWSFGWNAPVLLLKFDSSGNLLWQSHWGNTYLEEGNGVAVDSAGNALVTGRVSGPPPYTQSYSGNSTLSTPNFYLGKSDFGLSTPSLALITPNGTVQSPSGSQNSGVGIDELLLKYAIAGAVKPLDTFGLPPLQFYAFAGGVAVLVVALKMILRRPTRRLVASIR